MMNINPLRQEKCHLKTATKDCCEHFVSYLQGAGRVFCAGGDLKMFYGLGKSGTKKLAIFTLLLILFTSLHGTRMEPDFQGWLLHCRRVLEGDGVCQVLAGLPHRYIQKASRKLPTHRYWWLQLSLVLISFLLCLMIQYLTR